MQPSEAERIPQRISITSVPMQTIAQIYKGSYIVQHGAINRSMQKFALHFTLYFIDCPAAGAASWVCARWCGWSDPARRLGSSGVDPQPRRIEICSSGPPACAPIFNYDNAVNGSEFDKADTMHPTYSLLSLHCSASGLESITTSASLQNMLDSQLIGDVTHLVTLRPVTPKYL